MARSNSSTSTRLIITIVLSSAFFVAELVGETYSILMLCYIIPFSDTHRSWLPYQITGFDR